MRNRLLTLSLAALLVVPVGAATWGGKGMLEPDTQRDRDDGWMWLDADQTAGGARKVYFSGFQGQQGSTGTVVSTVFSPNSAALGTSHQTYPFLPWALLGVWKDCNNDGFIGLGDQGLWEYRVELLLDPATLKDPGICPAETVPTTIPENWAPVHNDGTWVHEFIPIGWDTWKTTVAADGQVTVRQNDLNPWNFNDTDSRVWGDWNLPEANIGRQCFVNPQPRGTYQNTGNFTTWADCQANGRIRGTGSALADLTNQHALWAQLQDTDNPWGHERDEAYVDVFDCDGGERVFEPRDPTYDPETKTGVTRPVVPDPTRGGAPWYPANFSDQNGFLGYDGPFARAFVYGYNISMVKQSGFNDKGSMGGTINETQTDKDDCDRTDARQGSSGNLPYANEADVENVATVRILPDHWMTFREGRREGGTQQQLGKQAPRDLGVRITGVEGCLMFTTSPYTNCNEGFWSGTVPTAVSRNPYANKDSLQPMEVTFITYYAHVGAKAALKFGFELPAGAATVTGTYGAEHCGAIPTGQWECNPDKWWPGDSIPRDARLGFDPQTTNGERSTWLATPIGVKVGQAYQLRDIDCYDESVTALRNEGLHYGVLTGTSCADDNSVLG